MPRSSIATFVVVLLLAAGTASGQDLTDLRITEISEGEQWVEIVNTGDGSVDVSAAELCANFAYEEVQDLTVKAHDDKGDEDLTLDAGEFLALEWDQVDADNGDMGLYLSGTSGSGFGDPENIIDYVRWGSDASEADREDVAVDAGIWTEGDFVEPAREGATIAFLGDDPKMNDDPADWGEGNPTPAGGNTVIPVELASFDAVVEKTNVLLTWETASETNNAGFEVQHRKEGTFTKVGFVRGAGTTSQPQSYRFRLEELSPGQHAFRLKQIDVDGSSEFGPTVEVAVRARILSDLRPNPTVHTARFTLAVRRSQTVTVDVYDALGRHVRTVFEGTVSPGHVRNLAVDGGPLSSGTYFVRVVGEQFRDTRKLLVAE